MKDGDIIIFRAPWGKITLYKIVKITEAKIYVDLFPNPERRGEYFPTDIFSPPRYLSLQTISESSKNSIFLLEYLPSEAH